MNKKFLRILLVVAFLIGLTSTAFAPSESTNSEISKLTIWVSDVANACGTWDGKGKMTIFDCKGILEWPCGRFLTPEGEWKPVPNGKYLNLPFICGHLEVELPPGCYWVVAGTVKPDRDEIFLNKTTHVGIVQVGCTKTACVKLYNPTLRLCWYWFRHGLRMQSIARSEAPIDPKKVEEIERLVEDLLRDVPTLPNEKVIERVYKEMLTSAMKQSEGKGDN